MFQPHKSRSLTALVRQLTAQLEQEPYDCAAPALCIALIHQVVDRGAERVEEIDRFAAFMRDQVRSRVGAAAAEP